MRSYQVTRVETGCNFIGRRTSVDPDALETIAQDAKCLGRRECVAAELCQLNVAAQTASLLGGRATVEASCRKPDCPSVEPVGVAAHYAREQIEMLIGEAPPATPAS